MNDLSKYLIPQTNLSEDQVIQELKGKQDLRIFLYESILITNKDLYETVYKEVASRPDSFGKYFYILALKYFSKNYDHVLRDMELMLSFDIPAHALNNDEYLRLPYFIARETKDKEHYRLAYIALSLSIGFSTKEHFLQTRRHAYICDSAQHIDYQAETYRGVLIDPSSLGSLREKQKFHLSEMRIIGLIRIRNEESIIESTLKAFSQYVDDIVIYDDHSDDDTVAVIKKIEKLCKVRKIIEGKEWLFNESKIHSILFEEARKLNGTHFVQLDADEVLSGSWMATPNLFRKVLSILKPGDCLALPWLDMADEHHYLDRSKLPNKLPGLHYTLYKDIVYCDDGSTMFDNKSFMHVNIIPQIYNNRYIITDYDFALLHLESMNLFNLTIKKDWYILFEHIACSKKLQKIEIYNVNSELSYQKKAQVEYDGKLSLYNIDTNCYKKINNWRLNYIYCLFRSNLLPPNAQKFLSLNYTSLFDDYNFNAGAPDVSLVPGNIRLPKVDVASEIEQMTSTFWVTNFLSSILPLFFIKISDFVKTYAKKNFYKIITYFALGYSKICLMNLEEDKPLNKKILAVCLGKMQLPLLYHIISKRYNLEKTSIDLLIYWKGASLDELKNAAAEAEKLLVFNKIVISETVFEPKVIRSLRTVYKFIIWRVKIQKFLSVREYSELILPKLFHPAEKLLAEIYAKAGIILFDEGLRACIDQTIQGNIKRDVDRIVSRGINEEHRLRIKAYYFSQRLSGIPNYIWRGLSFQRNIAKTQPHFMHPKIQYIDKEKLLSFYKEKSNTSDPNRKHVLLLTQNLYKAGFCSIEDEILLYNNAISYFIEKNIPISIKFHPRDDTSFRNKINNNSELITFYHDNSQPAEYYLVNNPPMAVVGIISSALFFAIEQNICPAYTLLGSRLMPQIAWDSDHKAIANLVQSRIFPLGMFKAETAPVITNSVKVNPKTKSTFTGLLEFTPYSHEQACPICSVTAKLYGSKYPWKKEAYFSQSPVLWCTSCGSGFVPDGEKLIQNYYQNFYGTTNRVDRQEEPSAYFQSIHDGDMSKAWYTSRANIHINILRKHNANFAKVLDFGGGPGYYLFLADPEEKYVVEPDVQSRKYLQYLNANILNLEDLRTDFFDIIESSHSIEHLTDSTLYSTLSRLFASLKPGGLFLIEVPHAGLSYLRIDQMHDPHTLFFTPQGLLSAVSRFDIEVLHSETRGPLFDVPHPEPIYSPPEDDFLASKRWWITILLRKRNVS